MGPLCACIHFHSSFHATHFSWDSIWRGHLPLERIIRPHQSATWTIDPLTLLTTSSSISLLHNRCAYLSFSGKKKKKAKQKLWLKRKMDFLAKCYQETCLSGKGNKSICMVKMSATTSGRTSQNVSLGFHNPMEEDFPLLFYHHLGLDCALSNWFHDWKESHLNPAADKQIESIFAHLHTPITAFGRFPNWQNVCFCSPVTPYVTLNL